MNEMKKSKEKLDVTRKIIKQIHKKSKMLMSQSKTCSLEYLLISESLVHGRHRDAAHLWAETVSASLRIRSKWIDQIDAHSK